MAHLSDQGYLYDDCRICGLGERPGIYWVDYEHDTPPPANGYGRHRKLLVCSSCIGDGLSALATLIKDEDGPDDLGVGESLPGASDETSGSTRRASKASAKTS